LTTEGVAKRRRRQERASPREGVARVRRRQEEGVARLKHRQVKAWPRAVTKRRERWFQGHSSGTSRE